ncbi:MAG TPA: glycosyltransferase [Sedimenticola sp.]|nr:glycosyltransferase [Sedimenticola sp.]
MSRLRLLLSCLHPLVANPGTLLPSLQALGRRFRKAGLSGVKTGLLELRAGRLLIDPDRIWRAHQARLQALRPAASQVIAAMPARPLISVLLPVYDTPAPLLEQALASVREQIYPAWELCVVDDGSGQPGVRRVLERFRRRDSRIRVHYSERNRGIARASNRALEMARGEYVALMDHDDLLQPHALLRMAQAILADAPDLLYSDEALFSEDMSTILQYFLRPAFSLERLRSHPYIVHLTLFRTELLRAIGGFDTDLTISQDYDLILRACERAAVITHIPEVLYLWRERKASAGFAQQGSVTEVSSGVIAAHLERSGLQARVSPGSVFNFYRLDYALPARHRVAVIIPTRNHGQLVKQCIDSFRGTVERVAYDLVIVDHASDDPASLDYFARLEGEHRLIRVEGPFNFSRINNQAVAALGAGYTHYLFCNNDIEAIEPGWLEHMLGFTVQPDVGMVGAKLLYPDRERVQHAGVCVGMHGAAEHYGKFMPVKLPDGSPHPGYMGSLVCDLEVSAVTAACMLVTREAYEAAGGFDEALAVGFGDVDLCLKVRERGYRVIQANNAVLLHHESYSRGKSRVDPHPEDSRLFRQRWQGIIEGGDPFYNPNLTLEDTAWSVALRGVDAQGLRRRVMPGPGRGVAAGPGATAP